ncbi:MAG: M14 family metallopeptidase [Spirochaetaceae bacterium]|nr:MAG: M14 family metallopeptidase [Spirochaetaceae bacterium]
MERFQTFAWIAITSILVGSIWAACRQPQSEQRIENAVGHFSTSYREARQKFLAAAVAAGAEIESLRHPAAGREGEELFTDLALLGPPNANTVLVLISGTHGVEGFAGSAVQTGLMREGIASKLKEDSSILMVHAINPFGFAHCRRANEDNIDLNRNFLDHSKPRPQNPQYDDLAEFIAPTSVLSLSKVAVWPRLLWYKVTGRTEELQQAISGGQYSHPKGLFYGGRFETWSNETVRAIVHKYLSGAQRVVVVDLHTGLGAYGDYEIILQQPKESSTYRRAVAIWGWDKVRTTYNRNSDQDDPGTEDRSFSAETSGPMKLAFPTLLPEAEVTAVTVDFGTTSAIKVFLAMRDENWLHYHGNPSNSRGKRIKAAFRQVFYPEDVDWKQMVWSGAKQIVYQAIERSSK